jgi:predicted RNA-binding protein with PUA domain
MITLLPKATRDQFGPLYAWQCPTCNRQHSARACGVHQCICGQAVKLQEPEQPKPAEPADDEQ